MEILEIQYWYDSNFGIKFPKYKNYQTWANKIGDVKDFTAFKI